MKSIEGQNEENEDVAGNQDSSDMEISVKQVENQDKADVIVRGVGKGNLGIERLGILTLSGIKCRPLLSIKPLFPTHQNRPGSAVHGE